MKIPKVLFSIEDVFFIKKFTLIKQINDDFAIYYNERNFDPKLVYLPYFDKIYYESEKKAYEEAIVRIETNLKSIRNIMKRKLK